MVNIIRIGARCLQQKSWQKYDKSVPDVFRPLPWSVSSGAKSVNILYIFTKMSWKQLFLALELIQLNEILFRTCVLWCTPVWHHNGSRACYRWYLRYYHSSSALFILYCLVIGLETEYIQYDLHSTFSGSGEFLFINVEKENWGRQSWTLLPPYNNNWLSW